MIRITAISGESFNDRNDLDPEYCPRIKIYIHAGPAISSTYDDQKPGDFISPEDKAMMPRMTRKTFQNTGILSVVLFMFNIVLSQAFILTGCHHITGVRILVSTIVFFIILTTMNNRYKMMNYRLFIVKVANLIGLATLTLCYGHHLKMFGCEFRVPVEITTITA